MELPEILTLDEVAKYLRVNNHTVYRLAKAGKLPAFKAGRAWRFHRADVERYVTYKYYTFGHTGARPYFFRAEVLKKYLQESRPKSDMSGHKYYIFDEAFSGKLGLTALYVEWKANSGSGRNWKEEFVEVEYKKVRLNTASPYEPVHWELLVVVAPAEFEKVQSNSEEYKHWTSYEIHRLSMPGTEVV
ncbi:MAG: helix-turn-helix domain-containing protein [Planctomycetes bacterium]|nr:helix-turn-helix domain-containing protein [Planctomycetota bacterium]